MDQQSTEQDFELRVAFDEDGGYEDMVAELYYKDEFLCLMSQEQGLGSLDVQLHPRSDGQPWQFKLAQLEGAIGRAKQRLWELRRTEENHSESRQR